MEEATTTVYVDKQVPGYWRLLPDPGRPAGTQAAFGEALRWPNGAELMSKARDRGLGTAGEFEPNLGRAVAELQ